MKGFVVVSTSLCFRTTHHKTTGWTPMETVRNTVDIERSQFPCFFTGERSRPFFGRSFGSLQRFLGNEALAFALSVNAAYKSQYA